MVLKYPNCLEELVLEPRIVRLASIDPLSDGGNGLGFRQIHQAQLGEFTCPSQRFSELFAKLRGIHFSQHW